MDDPSPGRPARYDTARLGARGEQLATEWYVARGYRVLARNWRCRDGEIDLVLARGATIAVCEVKTRSGDRHGSPFEAVTPAKARRLRRLAARWVNECAPFRPDVVRVDVAGVVGRRVEVREGAL